MQRSFVGFVFGFVPTQNKLSLVRALIFQIHLVINPSKTGEELLYCYLYHEDASFYLDICLG